MTDEQVIRAQVTKAILDLAKAAKLQPGSQLVIGCSTSEIAGGQIGKASAPEIGEWVAGTVLNVCRQREFIPIFQCCEHLNRALVMPKSAAVAAGYIRVNAIPQPKAGGSVPASSGVASASTGVTVFFSILPASRQVKPPAAKPGYVIYHTYYSTRVVADKTLADKLEVK